MALTKQELIEVIYQAVDHINQLLPGNGQLAKEPETVLLGEGGGLDSLGLITLIVGLEEKMQAEFDIESILLVEEALADPQGPYHSIDSLADWILIRTS